MNNTGNNGNNNRSRVIAVIAGLFFLVSLAIGIIYSQGSVYNSITIVFCILATAFTFFQLLPSIPVPHISPPKLSFKNTSSPHYILLMCSIIVLIVTILQPFIQYLYTSSIVTDHCNAQVIKAENKSFETGSIIEEANDKECIGISDGAFSFDITPLERPNGYNQLKKRVLAAIKSGNLNEAKSLWKTINVTNDAEMLIYLEDERVQESHYPFINVVLATMLTGVEFNVGRDNTQGAYIEQKEINDSCGLPRCTQIRLLIVNSGSGQSSGERAIYANTMAALITQKVQDYHIAGVIGWPFSGQAVSAIQVLAPAHIPMISPSASSSVLSGTSYFWRVAPVDSVQAQMAVPYILQKLQAKKVAVFYDPTDPYSHSLGEAFISEYKAKSHKNIIKELYTAGYTTTEAHMTELLRDALKQAPDLDLIYFSGYADDASALLDILPASASYSDLRVVGGDALYVTGSYRSGTYPVNSYNRLYFTTFAYPDEWKYKHLKPHQFFCEYTLAFSPQTACSSPSDNTKYHYNRASNDVILSYDAMMTFAQASKTVLTNSTNFVPDDIQQALAKVQGDQAVQGASGQISLGADGNPINKAIVILSVNAQGHEVIENIQGCLLKGSCSKTTS